MAVPQPNEGVSYAPKLAPADARVDWQAPATREFINRRYFISRINCPEFGRLCDANGTRLMRVHFRLTRNDGRCFVDVDLAGEAANQKQLRAFGEKFRRATLVSLDVSVLVTDHAVKRLTELRECEPIRSCPAENDINGALSFKQLRHRIAKARGVPIFSAVCQ